MRRCEESWKFYNLNKPLGSKNFVKFLLLINLKYLSIYIFFKIDKTKISVKYSLFDKNNK